MINKVIHIKNVGKFTDYSVNTTPTWNGEFRPITLVYGQNGIERTTFTTILKSLKENDALLYQLRTFGTLNSPEVSIKFDDQPAPIKYSNAEWDTNFPIIEIFDIHFINDNVYTGFEILPQHKKNLFEIIIGQEGIRLKKEISDVKKSIKEKNIVLKEIEAKVFKIISGFDIRTIINFQLDSEIEKRITEKKIEIDTAKSTEKIKNTALLKRITKIDFDIRFEKVIEFLQTSIDVISEKYLKMVDDHKSSLNLATKSEQWIKDEYDNISDNKCPFCLRSFDATVEIINAYKQYFNEEYISLQEKTKLLQNKVKTINPELILSNIEKENNHNTGLSEVCSDKKPVSTWIEQNKYKNGDSNSLFEPSNEYSKKIVESKVLTSDLNMKATKDLRTLFDNRQVFDYPKPISLIKTLISQATEKNDFILDSFAGSGTTMHAVMELNKEDDGNRKCIMVQMPENSETEPDKNICTDITRERVKRAIDKNGYDSGFKYYRLGIPIDAETMLAGQLPTYNQFAKYVYYLCTGENLEAEDKINEANFYVGEFGKQATYLVYKQDYETLARLALNLTLAEKIKEQQPGKKRIVYAPSCFLDEEYLTDNQFEYVGIPYNLFQRR